MACKCFFPFDTLLLFTLKRPTIIGIMLGKSHWMQRRLTWHISVSLWSAAQGFMRSYCVVLIDSRHVVPQVHIMVISPETRYATCPALRVFNRSYRFRNFAEFYATFIKMQKFLIADFWQMTQFYSGFPEMVAESLRSSIGNIDMA